MASYKAFFIQPNDDGSFKRSIVQRDTSELPPNEVLLKAQYSSLNFKDAMSAHGNKGVTREFPHQGGIDAAGEVEESTSGDFKPGDKVIVTGYDLGMNTAGGLAQYIRVPAAWVLHCPRGLNPKRSMLLGTAGLTAQLCINKLQRMGVTPDKGEVLVTGATGGVGSIAVALLANAGYTVVASSGKADQADLLRSIGASSVIDRAEFGELNKRPMLKERFAGAVDVVGGDTLGNVIKSLKAGGSVACCGLVQSPSFEATVLPFILRGVNLLGVDSVEIPLAEKQAAWKQLARAAKLPAIELLNKEITLKHVPTALETLFAGGSVGHTLVKIGR
jgi:putative YhdH/YhfP family quinone oxidoreductase